MNAAHRSEAQIVVEAATWCARLDAGPLSSEDDLAFRGWLADDPRRRAAFESVSRTLADPALTAAMRNITERSSMEEEGVLRSAEHEPQRANRVASSPSRCARLARDERRAHALTIRYPLSAIRFFPTSSWAAAAALLCAVWLAWPWVNVAMAPQVLVSAAPGETLDTVLEDGSRVELSGGTSMTVRMSAARRVVNMERGEAFFTVAPDSDRPFTVIADGGRVQVRGTAFNLGSTRDSLHLAVHHGRVAFGRDAPFAGTVEIAAGERAELRGGRVSEIETFDPAADDWRSEWLQTDGITLAALAERLSRRFGVPVRVDRALADKLIAGRFRLDDPEKLLRLLSAVHGFAVERLDTGLRVVTADT